jgi:hypothetical protein
MTPHSFDGNQKWKRSSIEMIPYLFNGDPKWKGLVIKMTSQSI